MLSVLFRNWRRKFLLVFSSEFASSLLECPAIVEQGVYANHDPLNSSSRIVDRRQRDGRELLIRIPVVSPTCQFANDQFANV